ncbi:MAG: DNA-3-methyladenine glycosylase [Bacteroidetes bacterium]|nr:DNA-3-methyladenine glycosylase [Bacteroidota bacterium]
MADLKNKNTGLLRVQKLSQSFYNRQDVVKIARQLLGKILITKFDGKITSGRIIETEAYNGEIDKASHAYNGRKTERTKIMYGTGGTAYVYLCYGIHHLFNVVTNKENVPHAILIRALEPIEGIDTMLKRTGKKKLDFTLTRGPGNVSKALGIFKHHSGEDLLSDKIFIADDGFKLSEKNIIASPRIGVDYAGEDAKLPYRFFVKDNEYVSGKK